MNRSGGKLASENRAFQRQTRRIASLIGGCAAGAILPASAGESRAASAKGNRPSASLLAAKDIAVVATESGSLAGYIRNGIFNFRRCGCARTRGNGQRRVDPLCALRQPKSSADAALEDVQCRTGSHHDFRQPHAADQQPRRRRAAKRSPLRIGSSRRAQYPPRAKSGSCCRQPTGLR